MNEKKLTEPAGISDSRLGVGAPQRNTNSAPSDEEMMAKELTE